MTNVTREAITLFIRLDEHDISDFAAPLFGGKIEIVLQSQHCYFDSCNARGRDSAFTFSNSVASVSFSVVGALQEIANY